MSDKKGICILELCLSRSLGGLELYVERIGKRLAQEGCIIHYGLAPGGMLEKRIQGSRFTVHPRVPYIDLAAAWAVLRQVRKRGVDVIHVHQSADLPFAAFAKAWTPAVKVVYTQHMQSSRRKKDLYHNWVYAKVDLLLAVTRQIEEMLSTTLRLDPAKIRCAYIGTDLPDLTRKNQFRQEIRSRFGIGDDAFLMVLPGRLDPLKGQQILVEALAILKQREIRPLVLFVGAETPDQKGFAHQLRSMIKASGLSRQCIFTGFVENPAPFYAAADLCLLTTQKETFGLVLIEAMAWATPVAGSRAGGVLEIIEDGRNGYFFEPIDAGDLANTIRRCIDQKRQLPGLGQYARQTVETRFRFDAHVRLLTRLFTDLTSSL